MDSNQLTSAIINLQKRYYYGEGEGSYSPFLGVVNFDIIDDVILKEKKRKRMHKNRV